MLRAGGEPCAGNPGSGAAGYQGGWRRAPSHHLRTGYLHPENLARLRDRGVGRTRSTELREHALGVEGDCCTNR
nr:hypothetical protein [Agreia bicolorata]